jgi:hypothetical protein
MLFPQKMISNKNLARVAAFCYLIVIATGLFYQNKRDAFPVGICCRHIQLCNWFINRSDYIFLFKQTNKLLLQLALAFVVIQTAEIAFNLLNQVSPLLILSNYIYLRTFQPDQPATLSQLSLNIQVQGYALCACRLCNL